MHKFSVIDGGWTGALRTIVLLFHAFVANFRVCGMWAIEPVQRFAVILFRSVGDRIFLVLLVNCRRHLFLFALVGEVGLFTLAHADCVVGVVSVSRANEALESAKAWFHVHVLVRHISNHLDGALPLSETLVLLDRVLN